MTTWKAFALFPLIPSLCFGSWLSDITGIDINAPRGTINIGPPNLAAIPPMLQNLPKDVATFFLNPVGGVLATTIRHAKEQARYGCQPVPQDILNSMSQFYPPAVIQGVCWNLYDPQRITLDSFLIGSLRNAAAITLEDVIVFQDLATARNPVIWGHELTHVVQYRRLGVEAFAALYTVQWNQIEGEAYRMQDFISSALANQQAYQQYWVMQQPFGTSIAPSAFSQSAMQVLPAVQYCGVLSTQVNQFGATETVEANRCPLALRVMEVQLVDLRNGARLALPCATDRCVIPAGGSSIFHDNGFLRPIAFGVVYLPAP